MKILLSTYACEPNRGSEAEIGWGIALELAKQHDIWVITRANNKSIHDTEFDRINKLQKLNFIYYDLPPWARFYKKGNKNFLIYYYFWQIGSYFAAKQFIKTEQIDVVHHLTGGMDFFPSGLSLLNKPFIWGPIGGEDTDKRILSNLPLSDKLKEYKRIILRYLLRHFDPFTWITAKKSDLILLYSSKSAKSSKRYLAKYKNKICKGVQTGLILDDRYINRKKNFKRHHPFTIIYAANLIPWKGGRFVCQAFIKFIKIFNADARLIIIGDGILKTDMENAFIASGIEDKVEFKGYMQMQDLIDKLPDGDVFLYPTYHHGLANICLQAMVMGLPVVCLEGDGTQTAFEKGGGIIVGINNYDSIPEKLAEGLYSLYKDKNFCSQMGRDAQKIVINNFEFNILAKKYLKIYLKAISNYATGSTKY